MFILSIPRSRVVRAFLDFKQIQALGADAHLNTCFSQFTLGWNQSVLASRRLV
jgi:hypothetical protein